MILSNQPDSDFYVIALIRGGEKFVWMYRADQTIDLFSSFGVFAALPCYSFTWVDTNNLRAKVLAELAKEGVRR